MVPRVVGRSPMRALSSAVRCTREEQFAIAEGRVP